MLLGWLRSSLIETVQGQVISSAISFDLWTSLQRSFSSSSRAKLTDLRRQLQTTTKGSLSCFDFLQKLRRIADELSFIGHSVPEDDLIQAVLTGLPAEYNNFNLTVTTAFNDHLTFADLQGMLLTHEARLLSQSATPSLPSANNPSALVATNTRYYKPNNNRPNKYYHNSKALLPTPPNQQPTYNIHQRPNFQNQTSHPSRPTPNPNWALNPQPRPTDPKPTCQICSKDGHMARFCWHRFDADPEYKPKPNFQAYSAQPTAPQSLDWVLDSGATNHVTSDLNNLSTFYNYGGTDNLQIGNGTGLSIAHIGSSSLLISNHSLLLCDILHVPSFTKKLLSISKLLLDNPNLILSFSSNSCQLKDLHTKTTILQIPSSSGLYTISLPSPHPSPQALLGLRASATTWHARFGHPSNDTTLKILNSQSLPCSSNKLELCHDCCMAKSHHLPFSTSLSTTSSPLELIHSDVWGPSPIESFNGFRYYIIFVDDFSRFTWLYFMTHKSEVPKIFAAFKCQVENLLNTTIKTLRTDGGTEYKPIHSHFPQIIHQTTCPYTPQ